MPPRLGHQPLAHPVLLTTLHLELLTQQHFLEGFRETEGKSLDPFFASLLKNHWLEESQHAKIDALELKKLADAATPAQVEAAVGDYVDILHAFAGLLTQQADLDVKSLARATRREFTEAERGILADTQARAYRRAFVVLGVENPGFVKYLEQFSAAAPARLAAQLGALS